MSACYNEPMKIGIFDSGMGGLIITHSLMAALPSYDLLYLGDTARVPYGDRTPNEVYQFTLEAVEYLFAQDCLLIIVACNTASAEALRRIQQEVLPAKYPDRRVLGVLIPAAEEAVRATRNHRIGVLATRGTVQSGTFVKEITKLSSRVTVTQEAAPLLVPMVEAADFSHAETMLKQYLAPLLAANIDTLVLGCTHYPMVKDLIRREVGKDVTVLSQDEFVPAKLKDYLDRHPELEQRLSKKSEYRFQVTADPSASVELSTRLFGEPVQLQQISLPPLTLDK